MAENDYTDEIKYVAAAPGHDVLIYLSGTKTFDAHPVVAWAVLHGDDGYICAQPLTVLAWDIDEHRAVRRPNGEVVYDDRFWATAELWLAEMKSNDGAPLKSEDIETVRLMPGDGSVLALDNFRNRFKGGQ